MEKPNVTTKNSILSIFLLHWANNLACVAGRVLRVSAFVLVAKLWTRVAKPAMQWWSQLRRLPISLIRVSLERSFPPAFLKYRGCQFQLKVTSKQRLWPAQESMDYFTHLEMQSATDKNCLFPTIPLLGCLCYFLSIGCI